MTNSAELLCPTCKTDDHQRLVYSDGWRINCRGCGWSKKLSEMIAAESRPSLQGDVVERVARAIAAELGRQDDDRPFKLSDDLKLAYLDQGEVDFALVARCALDACRGKWRPIAEAPEDGLVLVWGTSEGGDGLPEMWLTRSGVRYDPDTRKHRCSIEWPQEDVYVECTHYMPLPSPPSEQEEG